MQMVPAVSCDTEDVNENGGGEERGSCFHELYILLCKLYIDFVWMEILGPELLFRIKIIMNICILLLHLIIHLLNKSKIKNEKSYPCIEIEKKRKKKE